MAYSSEYVKANRERFALYGARYRDGIKAEMVAAYGGCCKHCGNDNPIVLCLDHVNDDARIEIEHFGLNARGGHKHYARLKVQGWPQDRFQLLCYNCNAVKEHNRRRDELHEGLGGHGDPEDRRKDRSKNGPPKSNKSGFKGVFWNAQRQRWQASIMENYKTQYLGIFDEIRDAALAYRKRALEIWGEEANVPSLEEIDKIAAEIDNPLPKSELSADDLGL